MFYSPKTTTWNIWSLKSRERR